MPDYPQRTPGRPIQSGIIGHIENKNATVLRTDMSAVEQAAEVLRGKLRSGYWASGEKLPSLAELALLCNVSRATAWKAVAVLREQSLVTTRRGGAITAGVQERPSAVPTESGRGFERLASRIGTDLLLGRFPGTRVPPL